MIASEFLRDKIRETPGTMSVRLFQISVLSRIVLDQRSTLWHCPYPMCALIRNKFLRHKIRKNIRHYRALSTEKTRTMVNIGRMHTDNHIK